MTTLSANTKAALVLNRMKRMKPGIKTGREVCGPLKLTYWGSIFVKLMELGLVERAQEKIDGELCEGYRLTKKAKSLKLN